MIKDNPKVCQKCEWKWQARKKTPVQCPRCKSYNWEKKEDGK